MRHCGRQRGTVPMLLVRRKPDNVTRPDFLGWSVPALRPTKTGGDDQRLPEWMCMPGSASARLERYVCTGHACRIGCLEWRINANCAGEPISWSFCGRLRTTSFYFHPLLSTLDDQLSTSALIAAAPCRPAVRPWTMHTHPT